MYIRAEAKRYKRDPEWFMWRQAQVLETVGQSSVSPDGGVINTFAAVCRSGEGGLSVLNY